MDIWWCAQDSFSRTGWRMLGTQIEGSLSNIFMNMLQQEIWESDLRIKKYLVRKRIINTGRNSAGNMYFCNKNKQFKRKDIAEINNKKDCASTSFVPSYCCRQTYFDGARKRRKSWMYQKVIDGLMNDIDGWLNWQDCSCLMGTRLSMLSEGSGVAAEPWLYNASIVYSASAIKSIRRLFFYPETAYWFSWGVRNDNIGVWWTRCHWWLTVCTGLTGGSYDWWLKTDRTDASSKIFQLLTDTRSSSI